MYKYINFVDADLKIKSKYILNEIFFYVFVSHTPFSNIMSCCFSKVRFAPFKLYFLFRARFRNHRTIFNSPHPRLMHIKLGKKKGRRRASHTSLEVPGSRQLSICSQLSPLQSRRGKHTSLHL